MLKEFEPAPYKYIGEITVLCHGRLTVHGNSHLRGLRINKGTEYTNKA
jgi:hypothetical protein